MTRPVWIAIGLMFIGAGLAVADLGVHEVWVGITLTGMALSMVAAVRARPNSGRQERQRKEVT